MASDKIKIIDSKPTVLGYILTSLGLAGYGQGIELESSRGSLEIISSLNSVLDSSSSSWPFGASKSKYTGNVIGQRFQISCRPRGRNTWCPILYGTIEQLPLGSKIKARFDLHPLAKIFAGFVPIFLFIFARSSSEIDRGFNICFTLVMLIIWMLACNFGIRVLSESDREELIAALELVSAPDRSQT